jgi:hypothetical protein
VTFVTLTLVPVFTYSLIEMAAHFSPVLAGHFNRTKVQCPVTQDPDTFLRYRKRIFDKVRA